MVKASGQIEQDLASLQQKTTQMAEALEPLYQGYLKALSESGKRQLVLAAYHLCTQAYPDRFLALSWDQRHQLQKELQAIAAQIYEQLIEQRDRAKVISRRPQNQDGLAFLQRLLEARAASSNTSSKRAREQDDDEFLPDERHQYRDDLSDEELDDEDLDDEDLDDDLRGLNEFETIDFAPERLDDSSEDRPEGRLEGRRRHRLGLEEDEDDLDFEMEVPAADQRLTIDEEEDLLAALEGLARRSIQMNGPGYLSGHLSGPITGSVGNPSDRPSGNDETDNNTRGESEPEQPLAPIHLVKQQMLLEKSIREVFKTVSEEANDLLQKATVMPSFPRALMAAASDPRGMGEPMNTVPNVVRVSVRVMHGEAVLDDDDDDDDDNEREGDSEREQLSRKFNRRSESSFDRKGSRHSLSARARRPRRIVPREMMAMEALPELAAISLRLSEVEFTDPTVSAWRGRLRQKLSELKTLGVRYKKTQRSLETARAEDAWRASWTIQNDTHE